MIFVSIMLGLLIEQSIFVYYTTSLLRPKYPKHITWLVFMAATALTQSLLFPIWERMEIRSPISLGITLALLFLLFQERMKRKLLVLLSYAASVVIAEIIGYSIGVGILKVNIAQLKSLNQFDIRLAIWQVIVYSLVFLTNVGFIRIFRKNNFSVEEKITNYTLAYVVSQIVVIFVLFICMMQEHIHTAVFIALTAMVAGMSVVAAFLLIKSFEVSIQKRAEKRFLEEQETLKTKHFKEMKLHYMEYKKLRHDFYDHISVIKRLTDNGYAVESQEYVHELSRKLEQLEKVTFCNNPAVDALLFSKNEIARAMGIQTMYRIEEPNGQVLSDMDLCSVISNLMQNAIRGAAEFAGEEKYIDFESYNMSGQYVIVVKNSSNYVSGDLRTTKSEKEGHGLGLKIIQSIVEKNDGNAIFRYDKNEFLSIVNLNIKT